MKLNHDNIRSLLLFIEKSENNSSRNESELLNFSEENEISKNELIYMIQRLTEADLIKSNIKYASNDVFWFNISAITWDGHKYIDNIRDPKIWRDSKNIASKLTSVSIDVMSSIAANIIVKTLNLD